jgi:hypothetical protein
MPPPFLKAKKRLSQQNHYYLKNHEKQADTAGALLNLFLPKPMPYSQVKSRYFDDYCTYKLILRTALKS